MADKKLVAYFSANGGTTKAMAERLAHAVGADVYEIAPAVPYTEADLDWRDKTSRSTLEMNDPSSRPAIAGELPDLSGYGEVFIGFPIWWYVAPTIVDTFVEGADLAGKKIALFAPPGEGNLGKSQEVLEPRRQPPSGSARSVLRPTQARQPSRLGPRSWACRPFR